MTQKVISLKQMHARLDIIHYVANKIDKVLQKLHQFKKSGDEVEAVPSTILQLIPEPDLVTNEELHILSQLGLEFVFDVEKKPQLCSKGLLVFALGLVEILAGACLILLTEGLSSSIGMGLISEGVSDCIGDTIEVITGEWSWTQWGVMKASSISMSLSTGGVGKFVEEGAEGFKIGLKAIPKAAEHGWTQVAKSSMKDVGEAIGKEVVQLGVMHTLGKIEDSAMEVITKKVANEVTDKICVELKIAFSDQNELGGIVDQIVISSQDKIAPSIKKDAFDFFNQRTHDVISSLIQDTSVTKSKPMLHVLDLSNGLSEHCLHGMASVFELLEDATYAKKIDDAVTELVEFFESFRLRLVEFCKESDRVGGAVTPASNAVAPEHHSLLESLKEELPQKTTESFTESVIMQTLGWVSSRVLNRTVNQKAVNYISEKTVHGISAVVRKAHHNPAQLPTITNQRASIRKITSHAKAILKKSKSISEADLQMAVDHYHCQVDIFDSQNKLIHVIKPLSEDSEDRVIKLVSNEGNPAKYSVVISGIHVERVENTPQCQLIEAFTCGLNYIDIFHEQHTFLEVRQAISSKISESPESYELHYHRERIRTDMIKVGKDIRNHESFGSLYEAPIIEDIYGVNVKIVDKDGKVLRPAGDGSDGPEITLVYMENENHPYSHFDWLTTNGNLEEVHSEYGNCFYVAIAESLKEHGHDLDGTKLREAVAGEIDKNSQRWHKLYQLKKMRTDLIKGAGCEVNETTRLKKDMYKYIQVSDKVQEIGYEQENGLKIKATQEYDKKPSGEITVVDDDYLQLGHGMEMIRVTNDARVVKRTIIAEGCNFVTNIGHCLSTEPSESQLQLHDGTKGSAPVSFHVIGSEAGANAGVLFGNSVVASKHYKELERVVSELKKKHVGDKNFKCKATVEIEDLVQPRENIEKMLREERCKPAVEFSIAVVDHEAFERSLPVRVRQRLSQRSPKQKRELLQQNAAELKAKRKQIFEKILSNGLEKDHLQKPEIDVDESDSAMNNQLDFLESRFKLIDEKIRDQRHKEGSESADETPIAQRVKKLTCEIVNHKGIKLTVVLCRDTELYMRSDMSNEDLEHCTVKGQPFAAAIQKIDLEDKKDDGVDKEVLVLKNRLKAFSKKAVSNK